MIDTPGIQKLEILFSWLKKKCLKTPIKPVDQVSVTLELLTNYWQSLSSNDHQGSCLSFRTFF